MAAWAVTTVAGLAKERLKSPRARLFVALDLPASIVSGIEAWQAGWTDPALRAVPAPNLHFTLAFLGYQAEREIERIASLALDAGAARSPRVELLPEPVPLPRSRPRLYAVDARGEGIVSIQRGISERLEAARLYKPEKRPFWPHLTVARVKGERREGRRSSRPATVDRPPGPLPEPLLEPFFCRRVRLYRSYLRPSGAEYVPLAELELPTD